MRYKFAFLIMILLLSAVFVLTPLYAANKDFIEIYFVNNTPNHNPNSLERYRYRFVRKTDEIYHSISDKRPFITTDDIEAYDWNKHDIYLKQQSWDRLRRYMSLKRPRDFELIFVVLLNKHILYYGLVTSGWCCIHAIPFTTPKYFYDNEPYMPKKMFEKRAFGIAYVNMDKFDYPEDPEIFNKLPKGERDPRCNPLLYQALLRTGKLIKEKPVLNK